MSRDSVPQQASETDQEGAADKGMEMDGVAMTEGESQGEHPHSPLVMCRLKSTILCPKIYRGEIYILV